SVRKRVVGGGEVGRSSDLATVAGPSGLAVGAGLGRHRGADLGERSSLIAGGSRGSHSLRATGTSASLEIRNAASPKKRAPHRRVFFVAPASSPGELRPGCSTGGASPRAAGRLAVDGTPKGQND